MQSESDNRSKPIAKKSDQSRKSSLMFLILETGETFKKKMKIKDRHKFDEIIDSISINETLNEWEISYLINGERQHQSIQKKTFKWYSTRLNSNEDVSENNNREYLNNFWLKIASEKGIKITGFNRGNFEFEIIQNENFKLYTLFNLISTTLILFQSNTIVKILTFYTALLILNLKNKNRNSKPIVYILINVVITIYLNFILKSENTNDILMYFLLISIFYTTFAFASALQKINIKTKSIFLILTLMYIWTVIFSLKFEITKYATISVCLAAIFSKVVKFLNDKLKFNLSTVIVGFIVENFVCISTWIYFLKSVNLHNYPSSTYLFFIFFYIFFTLRGNLSNFSKYSLGIPSGYLVATNLTFIVLNIFIFYLLILIRKHKMEV